MNNKLKGFLVAAVIVAAIPFISTAKKSNDKITLCHNGHSITISVNAYQQHLNNHNKDGAKLTCYVGPCNSTPPSCPPPPKPPKKGKCPDGNSGCE